MAMTIRACRHWGGFRLTLNLRLPVLSSFVVRRWRVQRPEVSPAIEFCVSERVKGSDRMQLAALRSDRVWRTKCSSVAAYEEAHIITRPWSNTSSRWSTSEPAQVRSSTRSRPRHNAVAVPTMAGDQAERDLAKNEDLVPGPFFLAAAGENSMGMHGYLRAILP